MKIVVPKLQERILYGTRNAFLLVYCIVPNVPISPQNPKLIWFTILLRNTAPRNLISPSSVNFVIKKCKDFTLYVTIETLNTQCKSDQEQEMWNVEHIVGDVEDHRLREELRSCQHFSVDSELERATHKVFNYAVETINETIVNEKLDHFFNNLKCVAKVNLAFGFILKNIEHGGFRYFYAHENNTLLDRSKLVCTHDDSANLKAFFNKTDVIECCSQERTNTKWSFYKLTNLTVFAVLLKEVPMGCKDAVLTKPLLKNHTMNPLTFEESTRQPYNDNLCLLRALAFHLHGTQRLEEETSKFFNLFIIKMDGLCADQFQGVHMNDIPIVEVLLTLNILLYDIEIVDGNIVGKFARRSVQKYENTVPLLRYNNHICYVNNINAVFQSFDVLIVTLFSTEPLIWSDI